MKVAFMDCTSTAASLHAGIDLCEQIMAGDAAGVIEHIKRGIGRKDRSSDDPEAACPCNLRSGVTVSTKRCLASKSSREQCRAARRGTRRAPEPLRRISTIGLVMPGARELAADSVVASTGMLRECPTQLHFPAQRSINSALPRGEHLHSE